MKTNCYLRLALASALLFFSMAMPASAAEVSGVKFDDGVKIANQDLRLNGAGVRYKAVFKVYAAALYLAGKKTTVADVLSAPGPKRITLVMLRSVGNEEFGQSFMSGIQKNSDKAERAKLVMQLQKFGELFASIPELKKGDTLMMDYIPGSGSHLTLNGKKIMEPIPDAAFYPVFLKIWLGDNPADAKLKQALLGEGEESPRNF